MSESASNDPSPWRGTIDNFASAKQAYMNNHAARTYDSSRHVSKKGVDAYVPASLSTDAEVPIVIVLDATGSMGSWFGTIVGKLPDRRAHV